jgi:glycolate oxidase FAD binding subunit
VIAPSSAEDLAQALQDAAARSHSIAVVGNNSKSRMGGPVLSAEVALTTTRLRRILQYEPNDLTISVEAGVPFSELQKLLAARGQMIALDPPYAAEASVGGVVATNSSGPMRAAFGSARDMVIGMSFAMLDGKVLTTGGMVVKNVAGLDIGKLMIGSFGTLAVIVSVNFRVHAQPRETRSFIFSFDELDSAIERRNAVLHGVLQPLCVDLISPPAAARLDRRGHVLAIRVAGSLKVLKRYARDLCAVDQLTGEKDVEFWSQIRDFSPQFLRCEPGAIVLRVSTSLSEVGPLLREVTGPCVSRAASGVSYLHFTDWNSAAAMLKTAIERGWSAAVDYAPDDIRACKDLWLPSSCPADLNTFDMMKKVKQMFDPQGLLNRSRLYGRI